ncbi:MAG TPA: methionyl-tRNA formyltransferase [Ignavibacteria bacterium]|nr:methionyl-tRNA formyltransferase [Ignavibacteria bacterium]
MRIVFMGTPDFAVPSLKILIQNGYDIRAVVTVPDKPKGRGLKLQSSEVKIFALQNGLRILQPENLKDEKFKTEITEINPDLIIVVAYRILPDTIYKIPKFGTFNLHASLLPKYRGAAPINHAIINGETETGVTTFFLDKKVDTGEIIYQRSVSIDNKDFGELYNELKFVGAELVLETVKIIESGEVKLKKQSDEVSTNAPKIFKEFCRINWEDTQENIYNKIRGLSPIPGAWTTYENKTLKIFKSQKTDIESTKQYGETEVSEEGLFVNTLDKKIKIIELQKEGKKRITASEYIKGLQIKNFKFI